MEGDPPGVSQYGNQGGPFEFEMKAGWSPNIHQIDRRLLLPAFPDSSLLFNPFSEEKRSSPIWLDGGNTILEMVWTLPPEIEVDMLPEHF